MLPRVGIDEPAGVLCLLLVCCGEQDGGVVFTVRHDVCMFEDGDDVMTLGDEGADDHTGSVRCRGPGPGP